MPTPTENELDKFEYEEPHLVYTTEYVEPSFDEYFEMDIKPIICDQTSCQQNIEPDKKDQEEEQTQKETTMDISLSKCQKQTNGKKSQNQNTLQ